MKVRELIELLEDFDPEAVVVYPSDDYSSKELVPGKKDEITEIQVKSKGVPKSFVCFDFYGKLILE